jgi:hypothetical protein
MYKYRITTIKNSTIEWYQKDPVLEAHLTESYINTGIMTLTTVVSESHDDTDVIIKDVTFLDEESFLNFKSDPLVIAYIQGRKAYEASNGIVRIKENIA